MPGKSRKRKRPIALLLAFNGVLALVFFEALLRFTDYSTDDLFYLVRSTDEPYNTSNVFYKASANYSQVSKADIRIEDIMAGDMTYNYYREKHDEACRPKGNKTRIVMFGDSVTRGHTSPYGTIAVSIGRYLEEIGDSGHVSIEVLNFAHGAYQPPEIYHSVVRYSGCGADIIYVGLCANDLNDYTGPSPFYEFFAPGTRDLLNMIRKNWLLNDIIENSYTARFVAGRYMALAAFLDPDRFGLRYRTPEEGENINRQNFIFFNKTISLLLESGKPVVVAVYPEIGYNETGNGFYYNHMPDSEENEIFAYLNSFGGNITVIDIKEGLIARGISSKEVRFREDDTIHFSSHGNSIVAQIIYDAMKKNELI